MGRNVNDLKTKLLANADFLKAYNAKLEELRTKIYVDGLAERALERYAEAYYAYPEHADLVEESVYEEYLEKIRAYITSKKEGK